MGRNSRGELRLNIELSERLDSHQIGCRWIRPGAPRSVAVAVSHGLNGNAGEMRSLSRVHCRIRDDGQRHVSIFHPSNGKRAGVRYVGLGETIGQSGYWGKTASAASPGLSISLYGTLRSPRDTASRRYRAVLMTSFMASLHRTAEVLRPAAETAPTLPRNRRGRFHTCLGRRHCAILLSTGTAASRRTAGYRATPRRGQCAPDLNGIDPKPPR